MSDDEAERLTWPDVFRLLPTLHEESDGALLKLDYGLTRVWWKAETNMVQAYSLQLVGWLGQGWIPADDYPTPGARGQTFPPSVLEALPREMRESRERFANEILMSDEGDRE